MCATIVWAINAAAYGPALVTETTSRLGIAPEPTDFRIASSRVRRSAVHFTLTRNMCDCGSVIGLRDDPASRDETTADDLLGWLHGLPAIAPHTTRLAILRAWSPTDEAITPTHARGVTIAAVDEALLRGLRDDALLTIDY